MSKTVITILLIFCIQIIVSADTEAYIEKQKKLYETSIVDAEKEWEAAKKAKTAEEIFALKKYKLSSLVLQVNQYSLVAFQNSY